MCVLFFHHFDIKFYLLVGYRVAFREYAWQNMCLLFMFCLRKVFRNVSHRHTICDEYLKKDFSYFNVICMSYEQCHFIKRQNFSSLTDLSSSRKDSLGSRRTETLFIIHSKEKFLRYCLFLSTFLI